MQNFDKITITGMLLSNGKSSWCDENHERMGQTQCLTTWWCEHSVIFNWWLQRKNSSSEEQFVIGFL